MAMAQVQDLVLDKVINRLKREFPIKRAYLFGSRARGDYHKKSDYDLLIIVEESSDSKVDREVKALELIKDLDISADIFIYTQSEFVDWKDDFGSIPERAVSLGQELPLA